MKNYSVNGIKVASAAHPHIIMGTKQTDKDRARLREKIQKLFNEIERESVPGTEEYEDENPEEMGGKRILTPSS